MQQKSEQVSPEFLKALQEESKNRIFSTNFLLHHYATLSFYIFEYLYTKEKLFSAYDLLAKLEATVDFLVFRYVLKNSKSGSSATVTTTSNSNSGDGEAQREEIVKQLEAIQADLTKQAELVKQLKDENKEARYLLEQFQITNKYNKSASQKENGGWTLVHDNDRIQSYYRSTESLHTILIDGIIDSPIFNVLSILYEADLYNTWVPYQKQSRILKRYSSFRYLCYFLFELPWPFYPRDLLCYGYGVDIIDQMNSILVVVHSVAESEYTKHNHPLYKGVQIPPEPKDGSVVRMDCNFAGFLIEPLNKNQTRLRIISNVDPKVSYIPVWLQNLGTKHAAHMVLQTVRKYAAKVDDKESPYRKLIQEKTEVYQDMASRFERHKKEQ